jgi:hypothetical protein
LQYLANKLKTAIEIMKRLKEAYEYLTKMVTTWCGRMEQNFYQL